ncbi:hypothetical protein AZE42_04514 [Rhizopogon vesiculosus]|uniref:Uncharacterized protein n=1 Tax=Rhizopogon vesiculosus TaxID=180088 RepID=A0A1J8QIY3_9AGAM|nr:hypothetical protein AZE42_04514 [Rhizopogon vesiculosus]
MTSSQQYVSDLVFRAAYDADRATAVSCSQESHGHVLLSGRSAWSHLSSCLYNADRATIMSCSQYYVSDLVFRAAYDADRAVTMSHPQYVRDLVFRVVYDADKAMAMSHSQYVRDLVFQAA